MHYRAIFALFPLIFFFTGCAGNETPKSSGTIAVVNGQNVLITDEVRAKRVCVSTFCEPNYTMYSSFGRRRYVSNPPSAPAPAPVANPVYSPPPAHQPYNKFTYTEKILDVNSAWNRTHGNPNLRVAIIDSGIDLTHPDLVNHLATDGNNVVGYDFFRNTNTPTDEAGHGTHVAGIISFIATDVKLMPLKFLGPNGSGGIYDGIRAIDFAIENGAKVINASWGSGSYSQLLEQAVARAFNAGVTFVAAAGNDAHNFDYYPNFPGAMPGAISVASSTINDYLASYSNFGTSVMIAAPGDQIVSTYPGGGYETMSGTSMASPQVAATVALLKSVNPNISEADVRSTLCSTSDRVLTNATHCGRMNTGRAVNSL